jgi:hypothetical protein
VRIATILLIAVGPAPDVCAGPVLISIGAGLRVEHRSV